MAPLTEHAVLGEIAEDLRSLGFTDYEAQAYLALLRENPATAYQVAKVSGLPRANVYSALESLTKKGAVQPVTENPARYAPMDPTVLFERIAAGIGGQCRRVVAKLSSLRKTEDDQYVWSVSGEENIRAKIDSMIESATGHIWVKGPEHLLEPHRFGLQRAAERGVEVIVILFGDPAALKRYRYDAPSRVYMHEGSGIKVGLGDSLVTITTDFREALTVNTAEGGFGAHTRNLPIVNLAESLIRHEIYLAEIFDHFGSHLEAEFGVALSRLRRRYLPAPQAEALDQMLRTPQVKVARG